MKPPCKIPRNWDSRQPHQKRSKHTCPLSDYVQPHKLIRRRDYEHTFTVCFACKGEHLEGKRYHYYCSTCNLEFHRGCHVLPMEMKHPLHLSHSLSLISLDPTLDTSKIPDEWRESSSDAEVSDYDYLPDEDGDYHHDDVADISPSSDVSREKCKCCNRPFENLYYHCSTCKFSLNFTCTIKPPLPTILNTKSHNHTLTLFPRRIPLPCDACGLSLNNIHDVVYACLPCNYMVHRKCISLPRVIKITRHPHRLSLVPSFPSGDLSCGVCHHSIDVSFGHYSCTKGCHYGAHSKCATRKVVWDEKDLEEVPEEPEKDTESFEWIDEETIKHFTHDHHLKFQGKGCLLAGAKKFCEACCLPISVSDDIYSCMRCNFVLHEACACLPRVKDHPLHKHPLNLHRYLPYPYWFWGNDVTRGMFKCHGCERRGSGFVYRCSKKGCIFQLDVRCASILDNSVHESHPHHDHPLFISLTKGECMGCKSTDCSGHYLECIICKSYLGLHCATLPSVAHYKHDSHPLALCYGEEGAISGQYWCELCELKLDASEWFYTCDSCRVTLHVTCLLGMDMYMKPQHIIKKGGIDVKITRSESNTRPFCYECGGRCVHNLVFKCQDEYVCTLHCIHGFLNKGSKKRSEAHAGLFPIDKIGVDSRLLEIENVLSKQPRGVRSIGIWGMAGIGKTAIVEAAFLKMKKDYKSPCFIRNFEKEIKEKGLSGLREQQLPLYGRKKHDLKRSITYQSQPEKTVFFILDDVRISKNAESFLGGLGWFGLGSLIIITSRDVNVLRQCRVNDIYEVKGLDDKEALKLFSGCAFGEVLPKEGYLKMSEMVVKYANGNAKALGYYGRELNGKTPEEMETAFLQLKQSPPHEILELFKSSYDELNDNEKNIFLDIACFFRGESEEHVLQVLKRYGFVSIGFKNLLHKSLVFVSGKRVELHNLIQDVAWEIHNQEVKNGKARRLCGVHSIQPLLEDEETNSNGKHGLDRETIETMLLDASGLSFVVDPAAFHNMDNLRLLKIYCSDHEHPPRLDFRKRLLSLPSELWLLHWEYYLLQSLPEEFDLDTLVELNMPYSQLLKLWKGAKSLRSLKTINLHHSENLVEVNQLSEARSLELINLQGCTSLQSCPAIKNLEHLKVLDLRGCVELKIFPDVPPNIEELYLNGTDIREIPTTVQTLSKLVKLDLGNCRKLRNFKVMIHNMESLELLNLSGCTTLKKFPKISKKMEKLEYLYLSCTAIQWLHTTVSRMIGLKVMKVSKTLKLPSSLKNLKDLKVEIDEEVERSL
ncbi:hypothetical protein AALP_AA4G178600 [Arabis alpina]|uniref:Phorbol-ester/DAG-type domain-containing protein n=1 Tax=Arabis alpina TaxID=50452 RepID=A0A087H3Y7_ARAAL|nr:hypothetical protein AALP_AA4G178600 [Arabis alpina]